MIEGYLKPFRLDINRNRGRLLVYIREHIPCKELKPHSFAEDIADTFGLFYYLLNLFHFYKNTK